MVKIYGGNFLKKEWYKIASNSDVSNELLMDYFDKKYLFNNSFIARYERFEPKIQQEMDLEGFSVEFYFRER